MATVGFEEPMKRNCLTVAICLGYCNKMWYTWWVTGSRNVFVTVLGAGKSQVKGLTGFVCGVGCSS